MIQITAEQIERVNLILSSVPKGAEKAISNVIRRANSTVRTEALKGITSVYAISRQNVRAESTIKVRTQQTDGGVVGTVSFAGYSNEKRKLKKQRALLDKGKITLAAIEQSYGSWRSHAEKGNCYHLIRETDQIFRILFPESVWLNGKRKARTDGESYFCGYLASPEEVRNTLSEGEKQTRSERTWQRR